MKTFQYVTFYHTLSQGRAGTRNGVLNTLVLSTLFSVSWLKIFPDRNLWEWWGTCENVE